MSTLKIPTSFQLYGQTINVVWKDTLSHDDDSCGQSHFRRNEIWMQKASIQYPKKDEQLQQTFCHEFVHYLLYFANYTAEVEGALHANEPLVERIAFLLQQALSTMEYEEVKIINPDVMIMR